MAWLRGASAVMLALGAFLCLQSGNARGASDPADDAYGGWHPDRSDEAPAPEASSKSIKLSAQVAAEKYDRQQDVHALKKGPGRDPTSAKALAYHIRNLNDKDPDVRLTACEMLRVLRSPEAVPPLIDVLRPERKEPVNVRLAAHGALVVITGQNFSPKAYDEWLSWWSKNKDEFMKKADTGVDEKNKIRAEASNAAGLELMKRGMYQEAQQQFIDAASYDPTVVDYKNNIGLASREQGKYLEAMEYFEEVIGMDPDLPQSYMNVGICYSRLNRSIEAYAWYKKATDRDNEGKLWDLCWMIGKEFMKRNEWSMAFEYLDQSRQKMEKLGVNKGHPQIYNDLAIACYGLDQYHSAWKELMNLEALGFDPNPDFKAKVRKALVDQGVDPDAEQKKALELQREALKAADNAAAGVAPDTASAPLEK